MNTPGTDGRGIDEGEHLCALFDGELQGDAARFALKRLGHDAQWRQACGRWQLYGDVMRGQATAIASSSFADRVAQAIAQEPALAPVASTATPASPRRSAAASRRGWIGGALAASVAVAALFVTRPFSSDTAPAAADGAATQVAAAATIPDAPAPGAPAPTLPGMPDAPDHQAGLGAAAVAAVEVPRRAAERRSTRSQSQRAALRASRQSAPVAATAVASAAPAPVSAIASTAAIASNATEAVAPKPFQPQHPEATARPWPRAVLPQYSGNSGITASYGTGAASPSFYPFEPSMAPAADQAGAADSDSAGPRN